MTKVEKFMADAPCHYRADEACAWAAGYNACLADQPQNSKVTDADVERAWAAMTSDIDKAVATEEALRSIRQRYAREEPKVTKNPDGTKTWTDNAGSETR